MTTKKTILKIISFALVLALVVACIPMSVSAEESAIRFGVISDIHYFADSLKCEGEVYEEWLYNKHKMYDDTDALLDNAFDGVLRNAVEDGATYVLLPGDLTKDGEKKSSLYVLAESVEFTRAVGSSSCSGFKKMQKETITNSFDSMGEVEPNVEALDW